MSDPYTDNYVIRVLVAFDQFVNVVFGGHPDETISARTGRCAAEGWLWARGLQWCLDKIQPKHTNLAIEHDKERAEMVDCIERSFEGESSHVSDPTHDNYVPRVLVAFDAEGWLWARCLQWCLDEIQPEHTDLAVKHDKERAQTVECIEQGFEDKSGAVKPGGSYLADHLRERNTRE